MKQAKNKITYVKFKELENEATKLTGLEIIQDCEYQKINYIKHTKKIGGTKYVQLRSKYFKLSKKVL